MAKPLGRVIMQARKEANLRPVDLARAAGLDPAALSRIEREERPNLTFATACQIAAALGLSLDDLANRAGMLKSRGVVRGGAGQGATFLKGVAALESLLERASSKAASLRKRLESER